MSREQPLKMIDSHPALRIDEGAVGPSQEKAAREVPFELRINGRSHILLMISPGEIRELAMGFCLSEGLVKDPGQVLAIEPGRGELPELGEALWADVTLPADLARAARISRSAPAATSCGMCGLESFNQIKSKITPVAPSGQKVDIKNIFALLQAMVTAQPVFTSTGGTHAAALALADGKPISVAEDVGRHNAMDKALGAAVLAGVDLSQCMAVLSGRVSFEVALKAARVGLFLLGSVSAPTSLAVQVLDSLGVTLVGFSRPPRANVYAHPHRITVDGRRLPGPAD